MSNQNPNNTYDTALILLHGNLSDTIMISNYLSNLSLKPMTIAADGGVLYALKNNITPDVIIGDLDSCQPEELFSFYNNSEIYSFWNDVIESQDPILRRFQSLIQKDKYTTIIKYPREKNFTDSELAVQYAMDQRVTNLIIFGLLGDRIDHMSANIMYLADLSRAKDIEITIVEGNQNITFIHKEKIFTGKKGDELSLIPLKDDCENVSSKGLYYQLNEETIQFGSTRGISNVFTNNEAAVTVKKGILMAVHRSLLPQ